jgi:GrpB-like predicted nucleotidyltransferase (UPF0157 family)
MAVDDWNREAPVRVVPYDPSWPSLFDRERAMLERPLAPWLTGPIEHIGSTAVPGLAAKPVIDIMVAVESLAASRAAFRAVSELGYVHFPYRPDVMHWFCKPSPSLRTHHLHLVPFRSPLWMERLAFRDHLRRDPETARQYGELKQRLAVRYELDREAYTDAKEPFIRAVVARALALSRSTG